MTDYTLYIVPNCFSCQQIIEALENISADYTLINIQEKGQHPPRGLMVFPALFRKNVLLAYGPDILGYLAA